MTATAFTYKTRSEQKLEWYEGLGRKLTPAEIADKVRCERAIYQRQWKADRDLTGPALAQHGKENDELLARLERELRP